MLQGSKQACAVASSMGCYDHPAVGLRRLILFTSGCFVLLGGWCVSGVCEKWQSWLVQWTCNMDCCDHRALGLRRIILFTFGCFELLGR